MTITHLVPLSPPWAIAVTNRGPAGVGATIAVDPDVIVLAPNEQGEVENIGNATHAIFKFSLPKGGTGDVGPAPSLDIGTVTTVPNGNAADAEIVGGDGDYELNLTIPAGPAGPPPTLDIGDVESGVTADADITGSDGDYELSLVLPIGPPPVLLPGTVTAVDNGDPLVMTLTETGPGEYTLDIEVPEGPQGVPGSMSPGDAVTLLTMATARMLGRTTAGTGIVQELTAANVRSFINVADGANVTAAADFANDNRLLRSDGTAKGTKASAVAIDDSAGVTGVVTLDIGNADTTLSRSSAGRLAVEGKAVAHKEEIALKAASGIPASGASVVINNLDCDELELTIEGVSHNSGSNQSFNLQLSTDNGGSFPLTIPMSDLGAASGLFSGLVIIQGLREGRILAHRPILAAGAADLTTVRTVAMTAYFVNAGGQVNAVRFLPTGGSLDAGTVTPSFRG